MSKRPFFPQQSGDRKKAKLDVTISDHNFPLSQNGPSKEPEQNNWGDDNDDEILLLASQACEDAYNDMSSLPDYSMCMQPVSTSTQLFDPDPSTSKSTFNFKKPSALPPSAISSNLKDKCSRISSPLPGMSSKVLPERTVHVLSDDLVFNDKIFKGQDSDLFYKQLLQLQEENAKLKSENGKLLEKCVTKEGEASILRTQLKSSQMSVDNARMEKIKAQEKVQMEWTEKLAATNSQIHELRTQLDFKNLEIISIKERCKMLESNKVKLNQVTVPSNDISSSQRMMNNSFSTKDASVRKPKVASSSVQTEDKAHFLKLNKTYRSEPSNLTTILPLLLESTPDQYPILEYNEKLQKHTDSSQNKCRVYSTFHRIPPTSTSGCRGGTSAVEAGRLHEDMTRLAAGMGDGKALENILSLFKTVLQEVQAQLDLVSKKMTTAFQKEMDERYIDSSATYLVISHRDLLCGRPLYAEEQAILARRVTAAIAVLASTDRQLLINNDTESIKILDLIQRICHLLDITSCALLYSGFLLSTTNLIIYLTKQTDNSKIIDILKHMISSRPMPTVSCELLKLLRKLTLDKHLIGKLCPKSSAGNLRLDYDQGVLLYKKDSCFIQVLLRQVESSLKCIEKQNLAEQAMDTTTQLIAVHSNLYDCNTAAGREGATGCDCQLILLQVIVYALRILAVMWKTIKHNDESQLTSSRLLAVCSLGTHMLYTRALSSLEFSSHLAHYEGHLQHYADMMRTHQHTDSYANMLSELSGIFQSSPEEGAPGAAGAAGAPGTASSLHKQAWIKSFDNFSIAD